MPCFGTYFTHVQTCDNVRVQSATQCTASVHTLHMSKPVITVVFKVLRNALLRYILYTCPNSKPVRTFVSKVLRNALLRYILYTCPNVRVQSATQCTASVHTLYMSKLQTCDNVRVQSATQCTASVHTLHLHISKPVIRFVFKVLRNALLRYMLYTFFNFGIAV